MNSEDSVIAELISRVNNAEREIERLRVLDPTGSSSRIGDLILTDGVEVLLDSNGTVLMED